jgi:PAS domain S-box-containing protein
MDSARLLIVEDETITAADIEDTLKDCGHQVVCTVATEQAALDAAELHKPDLVLMDIRLKGGNDGTRAAREILHRFGIASVFLTAHAEDETLEKAKAANPLGYIVKPFTSRELQATVQLALHKSRADRQLSNNHQEVLRTLSALDEAIIRVDELGRILFANDVIYRWTGRRAEEAIGQDVTAIVQLLEQATAADMSGFLARALRKREVVSIPHGLVIRAADGVERQVCGSIAPMKDGANRMNGAVIAFGRSPVWPKPSNGSAPSPAQSAHGAQTIAASRSMQELLTFASRVAASGVSSILLLGESGVGKDVIARFLHEHSKRKDHPFIAVNCAAIPDTLIESEIFGYEKGAFTDARSQKKGVLDLANGGTVFLDEIGELQPQLQAKLLRVLEDQTFRRLGGTQDISVDLRIITATNRDLAAAVRDKSFREDLYYRLNVIQLWIPPIRERPDDVLPLLEHFIRLYNAKFQCNIQGISEEAKTLLVAHSWPGNVREIRNVVERAMVLEDSGVITPASLALGQGAIYPAHVSPPPLAAGESSLEDVERAMLESALEKCSGNQTRAAKMLGVSRDTLRYRIKKFGLR